MQVSFDGLNGKRVGRMRGVDAHLHFLRERSGRSNERQEKPWGPGFHGSFFDSEYSFRNNAMLAGC